MIRPATAEDREVFLDLVFGYLEETAGAGGEVLPTRHNLDVYGAIFERYVSGASDGVVLITDDGTAFSMAGEIPLWLDTRHGRTAMSWGTYVTPALRRQGLSRLLRARLDESLREMGFDTVVGGYHRGNAAAEASLRGTGFEVFQTLGAKSLKEK